MFNFRFALSLFDGVNPNDPESGGISAALRLLQNAINYALYAAGVLSVIFVIVAGIRYAMSQGNPQGLEQAKKTLTYAIIGLLVSGMAFAIVNFFTLGQKGLFQ